MPDTLSREELAAIREQHGPIEAITYPMADREMRCYAEDGEYGVVWPCDVGRLLAHIDALTAAVEGVIFDLPIGVNVDYSRGYSAAIAASRAAVLAILKGEQ